jgi:hypothetical protein
LRAKGHRGRCARHPRSLRDRDLTLLFAGKAVSLAGDGVYMVALTGPVAARLGARATLIGAGALGLAATVAVWIAVPAVRAHHDAAVPAPEPEPSLS